MPSIMPLRNVLMSLSPIEKAIELITFLSTDSLMLNEAICLMFFTLGK